MTKDRFFLIYLFVLIGFIFIACAEKEFDPDNPQKSYEIAKEPYDDKNYERAVQRLGEFKSRFPYSKFAIEAELLIANAHFELEQYAEASAAYENFVKLHPKHPQIDFAMYRVGECYWEEAPEEIDREQDYTEKAVKEWEKLISKMPSSSYTEKAKTQVNLGKRRIAESMVFIANFYCRTESYHACAYRFTKLSEKFPEFRDIKKEALLKAASALDEVAEQKKADPKSDKNLYFKNYTAEQIKQKADEMRAESAKIQLGK